MSGGVMGVDDLRDATRDKRAEEYLLASHARDWYIGDATAAEWDAAYLAVDLWGEGE